MLAAFWFPHAVTKGNQCDSVPSVSITITTGWLKVEYLILRTLVLLQYVLLYSKC